MTHAPRLRLAALTLACLAAWPALAADEPAAEPAAAAPTAPVRPTPERIEVSGSRSNDSAIRRNQPAGKIVVGREELDRYGDSTVGEVLKRLPGVSMGGAPGRGGGIRMRGLSEGYTQILINGEPAARGFSFDSLSPDAIERIEVMRAPVAEHSARAIAGTINIILREDARKRQGQVRAALSSEDGRLQPRLDLQWGDRVDSLSYTLAGGYSHNDRANDSSTIERGTGRDGQPYDERSHSQSSGKGYNLNFSPRLSWRLDAGNTLSIQPFLMRNENRSHGETTRTRLYGSPADYARASSDSESNMQMARGFANWRRQFEDGAKLEARFGLNTNRSESSSARQEFATNGDRTRLTDNSATVRDNGFTSGGKWTRPIGEAHSLALGWDAEWSKREENRLNLVDGRPVLADFGDDVTARTQRLAAFAQDEWNAGPQWSAYAGLRWEGIGTRSTDALGDTRNRSSVWSPMLHAIYRIPGSEKDQLRASLTRSYKAPNTRDLISRPVLSDDPASTRDDPDRAGNPALQPELAWGLDLSYEHYFAEGGLVSVTLFQRSIDNLIRRQTLLEGDRWVSRPRNIGQASSQGVELEAKFRLAELIENGPPLELRANYSVYRSRVDDIPGPDNRLDGQVAQLLNLGLDYKFKSVPLTVGGNLNLVPEYTVRSAVDEWQEVDAKRQVDLYALYRFSSAVQLRLAASNLLHQDYDGSRRQTGLGATESFSSAPTYTQWTATLEVKF